MPDEPVWLVSYEDDGKDWATPERFLSIVAPVDGQRAGRERTKPQFLSGCVDAGRAYVPAQDEDDAPGAPVLQRFAVDDLVQADFHARGTYYDGIVAAVEIQRERPRRDTWRPITGASTASYVVPRFSITRGSPPWSAASMLGISSF